MDSLCPYSKACTCSGPLQGAHLSKNVYRNGLFLGGKPMCLGTVTFLGEGDYKQEEEKDASGRARPTDGGL